MPDLKKVIVDIRGGSATVWLNQPEILNALNPPVIDELKRSFTWIAEQEDIRVILLRGKGNSFCTGADLNWIFNSGMDAYKNNLKEIKSLASLFRLIYESDKVVINMLHGNVYGGALGFVGAGDISIALRDTKLRFPELKLGLVPAVIMPYVLTRMKIQEFRINMLTGLEIQAEDAQKAGLIDIICDNQGEMEMKSGELSEQIFSTSASAVAEAKSLLRRLNKPAINSANILESVRVLTGRMRTDDARDRIKKFLKKI